MTDNYNLKNHKQMDYEETKKSSDNHGIEYLIGKMKVFPSKPFYDTEISEWYLPDGLLGFTFGNRDRSIRRDCNELGYSKEEVKIHEGLHNRFSEEGNTPEHESMVRLRTRMGVYPSAIYAVPFNLDYLKKADVKPINTYAQELRKAA